MSRPRRAILGAMTSLAACSFLLAGCGGAPSERPITAAAVPPTTPPTASDQVPASRSEQRPGPAPAAEAPLGIQGDTYIVQPGDTLRSIAQRRFGDAEAWRQIYQANRALIGDNPDALQVGMHLTLGGPAAAPQPAAQVRPTRAPAAPVLAPPAGAADPLLALPTRAAPPAPTPSLSRPGSATTSPVSSAAAPSGSPTPDIPRLRGPASVPASPPYQPLPLQTDAALEAAVRELLGEEVERYGVVVKHLSDGRGLAIAPERPFYAASLFKLTVMYEVFKQRDLGLLDFDERLTITPPYLEYQVGELRWPLWSEVPIGDLLDAMIVQSANIPAILLHDKTGGWNIIRDLRSIGLRQTTLEGEDLPTSAHDMALLLEMIARGQAVSPETSREMVDLLSRQQINDRLPALLPRGTRVAHKTGNWDNATHDVGVVYAPSGPYVIAVLSDLPWASKPIAELSRLVYDYFEQGGDAA